MILTRKILEGLIGRLERRIDQFDERISARLSLQDDRGRRTEEQLAEFRQKQGADAAETAALQQETATQIAAEFQRLEELVCEGNTESAATRKHLAELRELQGASAAKLASELQQLDVAVRAERADTVATREQLVITAGLAEQIFALTSRLDSDVVAGFAAHNKRLETDLVILSEQDHQLGLGVSQLSQLVQRLDVKIAESLAKATQELAESHRYTAAILSKLIADHIQTAEIDGQSRSISQVQPIVDVAAHIAPPLRPLKSAKLPATIHKWLAKQGISPSRSVWCLDQKQLPQTPEDLPKLLEIMATCRQRLQPGEHLVWARQVGSEPLLTPSEIQQLLGLIGPAQGPVDVDDEGRKWCVAIVERRIEAVSVVLRWSIPALEELHIRLRPLADEMLDRLKLRDTAHAVDLPELDVDVDNWARLLPSLVATVAVRGGVPIGITLPSRFDEALEKMNDAVARLRRALRDGGRTQDISFQWVRGSVSIGKSFAVLDFARRHGIGFDLTPVNRGARESRLAAYDDRLPYRALSFDLRLPSFAAPNDAVIEIPRWPGRALDTRTVDGELHDLGALLDREFEQSRRRLDRVLDRARQKQFELQVNLDATQMDYWPQYFVHNWSFPAAAWLRLFEFDAVEIFSKGSPLLQVCPGERTEAGNTKFLNGAQFLAAAAKFAFRAPPAKTLRRYQIDAHSYLRNRFEITADAERLITWMPESLGITLELGSGFGVMARRLQERAQSYIGFDLTLDQASALRELGGVGLLADMQAMPFPDSIFDTIVADNVVEHAADPLQVLLECHRVLKSGGSVFMVIPPDYRRSDFCNEAHLWKSDEESVREALGRAGLRVVRQETIHLSDHGVSGAFPSSDGQTGLWHVEKMAATLSATKSKRVGEKAK